MVMSATVGGTPARLLGILTRIVQPPWKQQDDDDSPVSEAAIRATGRCTVGAAITDRGTSKGTGSNTDAAAGTDSANRRGTAAAVIS
jgi:hypothetical protein